jgi:ligand-binding SRPBCC domain-containing protein
MAHGEHVLSIRGFVPRPRGEVFAFFAAAENLERITPAQLRFEMITPVPIEMHAGTLIEYRLRLFGVPIYWKTRIAVWNPDTQFVDEQLKGPYAQWIHTHSFRDVEGGTEVADTVRYRLPLFPFGEAALPLVRMQLNRIFAYRTQRIDELLGSSAGVANQV